MKSRALVLSLTVLMALSAAQAATITLKQGVTGDWADRTLETYWNGTPRSDGFDWVADSGSSGEPSYVTVFAITDLFTLVAPTSGSDVIFIDSATLVLTPQTTRGDGDTVSVSRITTPWLSVGVTEANVTGNSIWANGLQSDGGTGTMFHPDKDSDSAYAVSIVWTEGWNIVNTFTVTGILQDLYDSGVNDGFVFYAIGADGIPAAESSESVAGASTFPQLIIEYHYAPVATTYALTVNSGNGSGNYTVGKDVAISADPANTTFWIFDAWTGDTTGITDTSAASTNIITQAADATISATYALGTTYTLDVIDGNGTGVYLEGTDVPIDADPPITAFYVFDAWTGDTTGIADTAAASTTISTQAADATIIATYVLGDTYTLDVIDGNGTGVYLAGTGVNIVANAPATAMYSFDAWTGDTTGIADTSAEDTTITTQAADATITATYSMLDSVQIPVGKDTFIADNWGAQEDKNYGVTGGLKCAKPSKMSILLGDFTMPVISDVFVGATLNMRNWWSDRTDLDLIVARLTQPWVEGTGNATVSNDGATHNTYDGVNPWATAGGDYALDGTETLTAISVVGQADPFSIDVSAIVSHWIANPAENKGLIILNVDDGNSDLIIYSREMLSGANAAYLEIFTLPTGTPLDLTVVSGSGTGTYTVGDIIAISAGTPPIGQLFSGWDGDVISVDDVSAPNTTIRMVNDLTVTAIYDTAYTLTVMSGTGGGLFAAGATTSIDAAAAPGGQGFSAWAGDTTGIVNLNAASTTMTTQAADATITATYADTYTLTVALGGLGGGNYVDGAVVTITPGGPTTGGWYFGTWVGDVAGVANIYVGFTTCTIMGADATITGTYGLPVTLDVTNGTGSNTYIDVRPVNIAADPPPAGDVFDQWIGDVNTVADVYAASTIIIIPLDDVAVTATYTSGYDLTVVSGIGSGTYAIGSTVTIAGDIPTQGDVFDAWVGATVADANARVTTVTLGADTTVTATYIDDGSDAMVFKDVIEDCWIRNNGTLNKASDFRDANTSFQDYIYIHWGEPGTPPWEAFDPSDPADGLVHGRGILEFDISDVNSVSSAKLWVYAFDVDGNSDTVININRGLASIDVNCTWFDSSTGTAWASAGGDYDTNTTATADVFTVGWHEIDVTDVVQDALAAAQNYATLVLTRDAVTNAFLKLRSQDYNIGELAAQLWIDTTPTAEYRDGDRNKDLFVDIIDLNMVLIDWGKSGGFVDANSDGNEDGTIDIVDLNLVLIDWGKTGYKP